MKKEGLLLAAIAWMALFATLNTARTQIWVQTSAPITNWSAVASSADGTKLVAAVKGGPIYTSLDSGVTWTPSSAPSTNWSSVASSADGSKLVASVAVYNGRQYEAGGPIYTSTNAGATWTQTSAPITNWAAIASSSDGGKLVALIGGAAPPAPPGPVFISDDSGATWIETSAPNAAYTSVASSADGSKLVAAGGSEIFSSSDSGTNWARHSVALVSIASSADGNRLVGVTPPVLKPGGTAFYVMTSTDSGTTWNTVTFGYGGRGVVACAAVGIPWVAAVAPNTAGTGGIVQVCAATCTYFNDVPRADWSSVASSADGAKLIAAVKGGGIWILQTTPELGLSIAPAGAEIILSWVVPSLGFALQENSDLNTTNWTDVSITPTLNLTNLQNEVRVLPLGNKRFYRLKH